jgi:hypothetical protein
MLPLLHRQQAVISMGIQLFIKLFFYKENQILIFITYLLHKEADEPTHGNFSKWNYKVDHIQLEIHNSIVK